MSEPIVLDAVAFRPVVGLAPALFAANDRVSPKATGADAPSA